MEKVQRINYKKKQSFNFNYECFNYSYYLFYSNYNIGKRNSKVQDYTDNLDILYPNSHAISQLKKKYLTDLFLCIPQIKYQFYFDFKTNQNDDRD